MVILNGSVNALLLYPNVKFSAMCILTLYGSKLASNFDVPLKDMLFGGTEKEMLTRGTDWCFDLARVAAVILDCIGLTSRFVFVANPYKAYNAHTLLEVYYNDSWGVIDPLYGYIFFDTKPINAKDIIHSAQLKSMNEDYKNMFNQISIAEYNPNDVNNKYIISKCIKAVEYLDPNTNI